MVESLFLGIGYNHPDSIGSTHSLEVDMKHYTCLHCNKHWLAEDSSECPFCGSTVVEDLGEF